MTVQSRTILELIAQIADSALAERIRDQYYHDVEAQTNFAQATYLDIAMRLENKFDEKVTTQFGATNEMISESVKLAREGGVALRELRTDFQSWLETVIGLSSSVQEMMRRLDNHDLELAQFRVSRDQSIDERKALQTDLVASKADRASIHEELRTAAIERREIMLQLAAIRHMLSGRPSNEEAAELVTMIRETKRRLDQLESYE